ncbi:hypothetical protein AXF42_Ash011469 [Apostasia shenzhenica]|uniref:Uncharacterized protein n=1 Tax=Apostasia shenzhenica TaxID=1088818 RepID=A0A2I0BAP6_9ASPA|nr:hypothetical protein AXF42_Ash011469 [Apostasia shenzhenica]
MASVVDYRFLAVTAIVTVGYQLLFFVVTALLRFNKVTDFAGTTNFIILAILTLCLKGEWHFRQNVMTSLVVVWGLRLASFLLLRILQWGEDRRLDKMRNSLAKLAFFWTLQALWVWTVSLPLTIVNASDRDPPINLQDVVGWIIWLVGITIEAISDQQKLVFKNSSSNTTKWCNVGFWKYSRHPNYFGEILIWWGIFVASIPVLRNGEWLVIFGPLFLTFLLLLVSGIPLLEASAEKRFGSVREYRIYKSTTSPLIPLPTTVYGSLPTWFKAVFLLELPMYSRRKGR